MRGIGDMADLAEGLDEIVGGVAIVFDDQQAHGDPVRLRVGRPADGALPLKFETAGHGLHQF